MSQEDWLTEILERKDKEATKELAKGLLDVDLLDKQSDIVKHILWENNDLVISAYTRYGKTYAVAVAVVLYILLNEGRTIMLLSPSFQQTSILRNYIAEIISTNEVPRQLIDYGGRHLKKEVNKKRITFTNGCELRVLSASGDAERLMGHGGELVVLDESCLITYQVFKNRISRMLGDSKNSKLIQIGNPWHKRNQMWRYWKKQDVENIHIPVGVGIEEGRITQSFVDEQKELLSPMEFQVLYEARFPDDAEDALIKWSWLQDAIQRELELLKPAVVMGLDVAEGGRDHCVLCVAKKKSNKYKVIEFVKWNKADTMKTVGRALKEIQKYNPSKVFVDEIGVGKGVCDRLKEKVEGVVGVKVGKKPTREKDRFLNRKSQYYWRLRGLFEEGNISIPRDQGFLSEASKMKYELMSNGKIKIVDPSDKSPDFADSLMLCCSGEKREELFIGTYNPMMK